MEYELTVVVGQIIFFILDLIILYSSYRNNGDSNTQKVFLRFAIVVTLQQLFATFTQLCDPSFNIFGPAVSYISYCGALIFMTASSYFWYIYLRLVLSDNQRESKLSTFLYLIPVIIITVACISSPFTHWVFYIDEFGVYQRGGLFLLQMACPYAYLFMSIIIGITRRKKVESAKIKNMLRFFLFFMIPSLIGVAVQMFVVKGGYSAIGISIGMVIMYLQIYIEDINENKRLKSLEAINEQLEKARMKAEAASEAKTVFLNNMSHDIRTPLNAILGFSALMAKEKKNPEAVDEYLKKINKSGEYLLSIVNNVLDMARIESGKVIVENSCVDLVEAEAKIKSYFEDFVKSANHNFSSSISITHRYIMTDLSKHQQILMNLISNAVKYSPENGNVYYSLEELPCHRPGYATYKMIIADDGIGMSPEFVEHIFDAFSRERDTTDSKIIGTGLGMSIVKKLTDLMGGTIEIESEKGKGSKFIIICDAEIVENPEEYIKETVDEITSDISFEGKRILLAEDNDLNAEIAMDILSDVGFMMERAENGKVCLDMINRAPDGYYDLILMDIQMPEMNGYEATKRIREMGNNIPIVAMTANAFEEDKKKAIDSGMNGHLSKPIDVAVVIKTLAKILK